MCILEKINAKKNGCSIHVSKLKLVRGLKHRKKSDHKYKDKNYEKICKSVILTKPEVNYLTR